MSEKRMTNIREEEEKVCFVKEAAKNFADNPEHSSYGELKPESLLALRWGLCDDSVLLLKLDDEFRPEVYQKAIAEVPHET